MNKEAILLLNIARWVVKNDFDDKYQIKFKNLDIVKIKY